MAKCSRKAPKKKWTPKKKEKTPDLQGTKAPPQKKTPSGMDYHAAARIHHNAKAQAYRDRAMRMHRKASSHAHRAAVHARFGTSAEEEAKQAFLEYAKSKGYKDDDANVFNFADGTYPDLAFRSPKLPYGGFTFHKDRNQSYWFLVAEREGKRIFAVKTSELPRHLMGW
jgi:hypothetical protein